MRGLLPSPRLFRGLLLLGHDPEDPEGENGDRRVLATTSSNLAKLTPSLAYEIASAGVMGDTGEQINTAQIELVGESEANGHDLLKHREPGERTERDEAADFLLAELADGPRPVKELKAEAKNAGITEITLQRAKSKLGIKASKTGYQGAWTWSLRGNQGVDHL
jgi:putative DNA primase/helicase